MCKYFSGIPAANEVLFIELLEIFLLDIELVKSVVISACDIVIFREDTDEGGEIVCLDRQVYDNYFALAG
jgi:hypothetical protein